MSVVLQAFGTSARNSKLLFDQFRSMAIGQGRFQSCQGCQVNGISCCSSIWRRPPRLRTEVLPCRNDVKHWQISIRFV